jgi:hypothetical protein
VLAGSLVEFLAVRLILDRFALADRARDALGFEGPLGGLRKACRRRIEPPWPPSVEQRAFLVASVRAIVTRSPRPSKSR